MIAIPPTRTTFKLHPEIIHSANMKKLTPLMWLAYLLGKQNALNKQMQDRYGYSIDLVDSLNSLSFKVLQSQLNEHAEHNLVFSPLSMLLVVSILNYGLGDLNTRARSLLLGANSFRLILSSFMTPFNGRLTCENLLAIQMTFSYLFFFQNNLTR